MIDLEVYLRYLRCDVCRKDLSSPTSCLTSVKRLPSLLDTPKWWISVRKCLTAVNQQALRLTPSGTRHSYASRASATRLAGEEPNRRPGHTPALCTLFR